MHCCRYQINQRVSKQVPFVMQLSFMLTQNKITMLLLFIWADRILYGPCANLSWVAEHARQRGGWRCWIDNESKTEQSTANWNGRDRAGLSLRANATTRLSPAAGACVVPATNLAGCLVLRARLPRHAQAAWWHTPAPFRPPRPPWVRGRTATCRARLPWTLSPRTVARAPVAGRAPCWSCWWVTRELQLGDAALQCSKLFWYIYSIMKIGLRRYTISQRGFTSLPLWNTTQSLECHRMDFRAFYSPSTLAFLYILSQAAVGTEWRHRLLPPQNGSSDWVVLSLASGSVWRVAPHGERPLLHGVVPSHADAALPGCSCICPWTAMHADQASARSRQARGAGRREGVGGCGAGRQTVRGRVAVGARRGCWPGELGVGEDRVRPRSFRSRKKKLRC